MMIQVTFKVVAQGDKEGCDRNKQLGIKDYFYRPVGLGLICRMRILCQMFFAAYFSANILVLSGQGVLQWLTPWILEGVAWIGILALPPTSLEVIL